MKTIRVSEATNLQLDYLIAKYLGREIKRDPMVFGDTSNGGYWIWEEPPKFKSKCFWKIGAGFTPTTNWAQGGPIIERQCMDILCLAGGDDGWRCDKYLPHERVEAYGPTPLIAAMRSYVASQLGDTVEVPEDL